MMRQRNVFSYADNSDMNVKVVRLRYRPKDIRLSLYILWRDLEHNVDNDEDDYNDPFMFTEFQSGKALRETLNNLKPTYMEVQF